MVRVASYHLVSGCFSVPDLHRGLYLKFVMFCLIIAHFPAVRNRQLSIPEAAGLLSSLRHF
jgi:hypothetical protein